MPDNEYTSASIIDKESNDYKAGYEAGYEAGEDKEFRHGLLFLGSALLAAIILKLMLFA